MTLKVMTFNIQHGRDYVKRVIDLNLMANVIKKENPDIVCLNEVRGDGPHVDYTDQTKALAASVGYFGYFGKAIELPQGLYGNAVLSKIPFTKVETIMIPDPLVKDESVSYESRCVIRAEFEGLNLVLLATHFGLAKGEQRNAVDTIKEEVKKTTKPVVFMGDLNMKPDDSKIGELKEILVDTSDIIEGDKFTFPSINPTRKIDYIFVSRDIVVKEAKIVEEVASDHFPHTAVISISE